MITRDELGPLLANGRYAELIARVMETLVKTAPSYPAAKRGTVAGWFTAHSGRTLHTLSIDARGVWFPGPRTCAAGASSATLNGSTIDYRPSRVIAADGNTLVFTRPWGESVKLFAYWIA